MFTITPEIIAVSSVLLLIAIILFLVLARASSRTPYFARGTLLTRAELKFYYVLKAVVRDQYDISCKVRLADIINCSDHHWQRGHGSKISSKHIDFVLSDPQTSEIILCIELDDKSHLRPDRIKRDKFVNKALNTAQVNFLRVPVTRGYDMAALMVEIEKHIVFRSE